MIRRNTILLAAAVLLLAGGALRLHSQAKPAKNVKLVVLVAVDQFRYDYLTRFRDEYSAGLDRLLKNGAVFVNANLEHYPTVTAVGHSTMLTGATPAESGIMGNDWYDRDSGKTVTSVLDDNEKQLNMGSATPGSASPRRMLVSTVGDELKRAQRTAKVIGMSLKDRSAILPSGHSANGAYWYDAKTGSFISSTYYFPDLPDWVKKFNDQRLPDKYAGQEWPYDKTPTGLFKMPSEAGPKLAGAVYSTPFGNEFLERFAEEAIEQEKLGQRDATDLLTVSFSSNDAVGHSFGPDSPQAHDISIRTDKVLGKFFAFLDSKIGMDHVIVVLTADHGVMPLAEQLAKDKMPGGRLSGASLFEPMQAALSARFGEGQWLLDTAGSSPYFNLQLMREKNVNRSEAERVAAASIEYAPHVSRVYTRTQLQLGEVPTDSISQRVVRSFNARRSGDLEVLLDPYYIRSKTGTTHGTPYSYDTHIPLIFMGPGVKAGRYVRPVALNDLAPSLATLLDVETPSGSVGHALADMMIDAADRNSH